MSYKRVGIRKQERRVRRLYAATRRSCFITSSQLISASRGTIGLPHRKTHLDSLSLPPSKFTFLVADPGTLIPCRNHEVGTETGENPIPPAAVVGVIDFLIVFLAVPRRIQNAFALSQSRYRLALDQRVELAGIEPETAAGSAVFYLHPLSLHRFKRHRA